MKSASCFRLPLLASIIALAATLTARTSAADNPYVGGWALVVPGGGPGWLGVEEQDGKVKAAILWVAGSVTPLESAKVEDGKLVLTRSETVDRTGPDGQKTKVKLTETITATADGDVLKLITVKPKASGNGENRAEFSGKRLPPMPPTPDLAQVRFGEPVSLFNGKNLDGWRLVEPNAVNGWSVKDGLLVNDPKQEEGKPHKNYGNLRTDREFEDFNLKLSVRVGKNQNSGIYLRGIYEVQVADTYGKPASAHGMGAVYSRIKPLVSAENPTGEWQNFDITLVNRHVTVMLNGKRVVDNQPVPGPTGGCLWPEVNKPGPIYLQGDHTGIEYRDIVLRPVVK